jgi:hypothetical protein
MLSISPRQVKKACERSPHAQGPVRQDMSFGRFKLAARIGVFQ